MKKLMLKVSCQKCDRCRISWTKQHKTFQRCSYVENGEVFSRQVKEDQEPCEHWVPIKDNLKRIIFDKKWRFRK